MTQLVVFLVSGVVLLFAIVLIALILRPREADDLPPVTELTRIVDLPGLCFPNAHLMLDERDYNMLCQRPELRQVARQLRRERREMVLLWLDHLQGDVKTLWRFRRFLVRNGASAGLLEEIHIAATAVLVHLFVQSLRVSVVLAGPFVVRAPLQTTRHQVETASQLCAHLFNKLPLATRLEVERRWVRELA